MVKTAEKKLTRPVINVLECKGCGRCIIACPKDVLEMSSELNERGYHFVKYKGSGCIGCGNCYYSCPEPLALEVHIVENDKEQK
ncbi:MAG: 4Fe-4S dicluster domain-containing protein [Phycisphaerae bacterium]|nr:4Fe-4S dicluster domain-containing protein [Phycisphaerae bacterium]